MWIRSSRFNRLRPLIPSPNSLTPPSIPPSSKLLSSNQFRPNQLQSPLISLHSYVIHLHIATNNEDRSFGHRREVLDSEREDRIGREGYVDIVEVSRGEGGGCTVGYVKLENRTSWSIGYDVHDLVEASM